MKTIILASSSASRAKLMQRLRLPFVQQSPDIDETARPDERAEALVLRLAQCKAEAVLNRQQPDASLLIASDQVACFHNTILGKPDGASGAVAQLLSCSGQRVDFYTGLYVYDTESASAQAAVVPTHVHFRTLSTAEVEAYVEADQPLDAAGSFRAEGLGISLFKAIASEDPTALIGLPLITLTKYLNYFGVSVLTPA